MKRKIIFFVTLTIIVTGCASLSGPKKPPRCNGKQTRALNQDKWDWENKGIITQEKTPKPFVTTPIILNTLESENATANVTLKAASLNSINHHTLSNPMTEITREK
ncbi:hypothetical protein ABID23_000679 [Bartonella silvatica]|uniref:Type IV secretion system protein VirB7 n=1 Tax=Bartonella silvatica TaxID=357760 RepID=A0ABV2HGE1_9HYPH